MHSGNDEAPAVRRRRHTQTMFAVDGFTLKQIPEAIGVSREGVRLIERKTRNLCYRRCEIVADQPV